VVDYSTCKKNVRCTKCQRHQKNGQKDVSPAAAEALVTKQQHNKKSLRNAAIDNQQKELRKK
jgi:hypothetical protein